LHILKPTISSRIGKQGGFEVLPSIESRCIEEYSLRRNHDEIKVFKNTSELSFARINEDHTADNAMPQMEMKMKQNDVDEELSLRRVLNQRRVR
jgi:hypothetical protein